MRCGFKDFPQSDAGKSRSDRGTALYLWPILKGKEEAWRRAIQEIQTFRHFEFVESRLRLGIRSEFIWFAKIPQGCVAIIVIQADAPLQVAAMMAASENRFDRWYVRQVLDLHGVALAEVPPHTIGQPMLAWRAADDKA